MSLLQQVGGVDRTHRHAQVDRQQRDGDRHHRVAEEQDPVVLDKAGARERV